MKVYAELPARRTLQIVADAAMLCWVAVWVWLGRAAAGSVLQLQAPAQDLQSAGTSFSSGMSTAATELARVPLIGETLRGPFDQLTQTGTSVTQAGQSVETAVSRAALVTELVVTLVPILLVGVVWLALRIRYALRAGQAARFRKAPGALELFAFRALATGDLDDLAAVSPDPAGGFRHRDFEVVHRLAELELRSLGLYATDPSGVGSTPQVAHGGPPRV